MTPVYRLYFMPIEQDERPRRIRETAAVEQLVSRAFGAGARKYNLPSGAPAVELPAGVSPVVSVSHSARHAVLAVSLDGRSIGVDIEEYRPQLRRVVAKFLNADEAAVCDSDEALLKAWTLKEAAYKAAATPGLSLLDIHLPSQGDIITLADGRTMRILESTPSENGHVSVVVA